jgi:hypothetical protein
MVQNGLQRLKTPIGSIVLDLALVLYITYTAGQFADRLQDVSAHVDSLESRAGTLSPEAARRIAVLEAAAVKAESDRIELKNDIVRRLDKIEDGQVELLRELKRR